MGEPNIPLRHKFLFATGILKGKFAVKDEKLTLDAALILAIGNISKAELHKRKSPTH